MGRVDGDRIIRFDGELLGEHSERAERYGFDQVRWLPPIIPQTFYAVGFNYKDHIEEAIKRSNGVARYPERPEVGYRAHSALIGHGETIVKPVDIKGRFELEAEVVAVIGKTLRHCSADEARAGIFGWTIGNDVSARQWQHNDRTFWRAKNCDTFKPMGPWIETDVDPENSTTRVCVNDTVVAEFRTGGMIFNAIDYLVEISRYITLSPGDMIWMGADGASGIAPGDQIDISISGIGTLSNNVVLGADLRSDK
ncbi:fumarylacetoacetate hydrolase family protein [bacterium AH-315-K03]|nr:fumarylacetoacetate hydrolase family protein [bacterium AH-315-K03]